MEVMGYVQSICITRLPIGRIGLIREMVGQDQEAVVVRLETVKPLRPLISTWRLLWWNVKAAFGWQVPIKPVQIPD